MARAERQRRPGDRLRAGGDRRADAWPTAWSAWPASAISTISPSAPARGLRFDLAAARHAIDFFGFLRHSKGEWAGRDLHPRALAGVRRRLAVRLAARRTACGASAPPTAPCRGRTARARLSAGIGLYLLVADGEQGAEVYSAATTRDQARIVFDEAKRMVAQLARAQAPGRAADQQPARRGQRLALHAAVLRQPAPWTA